MNLENYKTEQVHKNNIQVGDTIVCSDGKIRTVCKNDIKKDELFGVLIFGDSYKLGYQKISRVLFPVFQNNELKKWVAKK